MLEFDELDTGIEFAIENMNLLDANFVFQSKIATKS